MDAKTEAQHEKDLGSAVLDVVAESDWLQRHEAVVAAKVLAGVLAHYDLDPRTLERIQDEWGVDDALLESERAPL